SPQSTPALGSPARIDLMHPLATNGEELGHSTAKGARSFDSPDALRPRAGPPKQLGPTDGGVGSDLLRQHSIHAQGHSLMHPFVRVDPDPDHSTLLSEVATGRPFLLESYDDHPLSSQAGAATAGDRSVHRQQARPKNCESAWPWRPPWCPVRKTGP